MPMLELTKNLHIASIVVYALAFVPAALAWRGSVPLRRAAFGLASAGLLVQLVLLVSRWYSGGYIPITGLFSALHFLTIFLVGAALYLALRYKAHRLLAGALLLTLAALWKAGDGEMVLNPLTPSLDTPLFFLHVATSFAAYGLFAVSALVAVHRIANVPASDLGAERRMLDECIYVGYILFSWCMVAGSLWAFLAWGSYWTWRVKGLWSWLVWFYYSGVLHVRNRPRWQGRALDALAIAGFGLVLFTFLGLGLLLQEASHPLK